MPTLSHVNEEPVFPGQGSRKEYDSISPAREEVGRHGGERLVTIRHRAIPGTSTGCYYTCRGMDQRHVARFLLIVLLLSLSVLGSTGSPVYAAARDGLSCNPWSLIPSPKAGTSSNELEGVAVVSASDVWAVGSYFNLNLNSSQTLIERWNGSTWQVVTSPNAGTGNNDLKGVAVELSGNAWAVGSYFDPRFASFRTLIERWDGGRWNIMPSPNIGKSDNWLSGVTVDLSGNAWAVGEYFNPAQGNFQTLVEHWNGVGWQIVPSANRRARYSLLLGVDMGSIFSPIRVVSRVWAVGYSGNQTLTEASPNQVACS